MTNKLRRKLIKFYLVLVLCSGSAGITILKHSDDLFTTFLASMLLTIAGIFTAYLQSMLTAEVE